MRSILNMTGMMVLLNTLLIVSTAWLSIHLWQQGTVSIGAIAVANGLIIRLNQMSGWILRTITSLFENIGTVQNGVETISKPNLVVDRPGAGELTVPRGEVRFQNVRFEYNKDLPVIRDLSLLVTPGEKIGLGTREIGGGDASFGFGVQEDRQSITTVHKAIELGVNWLDAARAHDSGHLEEIVGKALKGKRDRMMIAAWGGILPRENGSGLHGKLVADSIKTGEACGAWCGNQKGLRN